MQNIETARLLLRAIRSGDEDDLFEILSDEETCLDDGGFHAFAVQDAEFFALFQRMKDQRRYAIILKSEGKLIGMINLQEDNRAVTTYELGFVLNPNYRRRGYMFEAVSNLMDVWFQHTDTAMFTASHFPHNEASKNLLRKLGFSYEGRKHKAVQHEVCGATDLVCYYKEK